MSAAGTAPFFVGLPPDDAAARERALNPGASFIVQAPAGSGKTSLLVQRFLVLLSRVEQPEAIIAITFTRKAAAEMRARIVTALADAEQGKEGSTAHERLTLEAAQAALRRDSQMSWNLRQHPARLRIQTIDSLCASIVQRMPWMARTGGMPGIVEDARELYREAAQNTLEQLWRGGVAGQAVELLLLHLDNNYRTVQSMFENMLSRRDQWLRHVGAGAAGEELRAGLEESLARVVRHGLKQAATRIPPLNLARLVELHDVSGRRMETVRPPLGEIPGTLASDLAAWQALSNFLLTTSDAWRKTVNAGQGFPPHYKAEKQEFLDIVAEFSTDAALHQALVDIRKLPDARFREEQWKILEALLGLLPIAAAELKLTFAERNAVDFVELGEAARAALGHADHPADLALSLGERIHHLLIDEFQDTSVSQFELATRLVAGWEPSEARTLFLVGDPMQSIYRFREAEVGLFLQARHEGIGAVTCEPLRLTANFRSRPAIVEWVNFAFSQIFPQAEDIASGSVTYSESTASRSSVADSGVTVHPYTSAEEEPEAAAVASLCEEALGQGTVAVLVRARTHAASIVAELSRRGIPFRAVDFNPLAERPPIRDLQALTRALLHPGDRASWLALLRAPWCGLTLDELHSLAAPDLRAIIWERLQAQLDRSPRLSRVKEALEPALAEVRHVRVRQCVETAWHRLGGPSCLVSPEDRTDCERYFDLLDELDTGGEISFARLERRIGELFGLAPPAEGPAVELMTIHKAKGLEWDTVILPGLGRESAGDSKQLLQWSEAPGPNGETRLLLAPVEATREGQADPIYEYLARLERQRGRLENTRLLYVAATRARERLHLFGHVEPNAKGELKARSGTLLHLLWPVVEHHFQSAVSLGHGIATDSPALREQLLRRFPEDWQVAHGEARAPAWQPRGAEETEITFEWAGDALRHAGSVTHRWLERIAQEGLGAWPPERLGSQAGAIRAALESLGLAESDVAQAVESVETALGHTLADRRGRWLLESHQESASELRVSVVDEGVIYHCSIDRTFVDAHGTRWVVDFKTGSHEGAGLPEFLDRERERYGARMNRYARYFQATENRPVRLGLYYPLLGGWREWEPD